MKPTDRMRIAYVLNRSSERRATFEETIKVLKETLGEDKIKIISEHPEQEKRK